MSGPIAVTGSVAFDTIMVFPGKFGDHIVPEKTHLINVSFLVDRLERRRGGTAANIAYTMALLGERPLLCAAVGSDFTDYGVTLQKVGVDISRVYACDDIPTATGFITTDLSDNQITAFYPGAMARAGAVDLTSLSGVAEVVVAPDAPDAMAAHIDQASAIGARLIFAPAQQIPSLDEAVLRRGLEAAWLIVGNDYEFEMIRQRTDLDVNALRRGREDRIVAVTRGARGSLLHTSNDIVEIPVAHTEAVVDPTGAGDAYIAGLATGIRAGRSLAEAGRVAALAATYAVESNGTQEHTFTLDEFSRRYSASFEAALTPVG